MTRLTGAHRVYGGVLRSWLCGTLMRTLIAYLPFLWFIHTVLSGDAFVSLFTAVAGMLLWNAVVLSVLLISLSTMPVESLTREAGAGRSSSRLTSGVSAAQIVGMILIPIASSSVANRRRDADATSALRVASASRRRFATLEPSVGIIPVGLPVVFFMSESLFLTLITPVAWLIALAIRPAAIRRAESVLHSKEPVITPSEGRWQCWAARPAQFCATGATGDAASDRRTPALGAVLAAAARLRTAAVVVGYQLVCVRRGARADAPAGAGGRAQ